MKKVYIYKTLANFSKKIIYALLYIAVLYKAQFKSFTHYANLKYTVRINLNVDNPKSLAELDFIMKHFQPAFPSFQFSLSLFLSAHTDTHINAHTLLALPSFI